MQNYQSGGRTRNVINIADVGNGGTAAYTFTAQGSAAPALPTDGYANYGTQKTLHASVKYNAGAGTTILYVWAYHSFSGEWAKLNIYDGTDGKNSPVTMVVSNGTSFYCLVPIDGVERIHVTCHQLGDSNTGTATVYLGVNTI